MSKITNPNKLLVLQILYVSIHRNLWTFIHDDIGDYLLKYAANQIQVSSFIKLFKIVYLGF